MSKSFVLVLFFLLLTPWCARADSGTRVYLHNRPVEGQWQGGEFYVPSEQLSGYLDSEESSRVKLDQAEGVVRVDQQSLPFDGHSIPLGVLARLLGLRRVESKDYIDFVRAGGETHAASSRGGGAGRREYQIAAAHLDEYLRKFPPIQDGARNNRIQTVGRKVVAVTPLSNIEWRFVLVKDPLPNAACVGEGHVIVTSGLLDLGISDDELAGVLGHEIAHGVRRHVFRRPELIREIQSLLKDYKVLQERLEEGSVSMELRGRVDDYERRRASLQYRLDHEIFYTQLDEEEADVLGMRYAVLAGYSAEGLGDCLRKLNHFVESFGAAVTQDNLSHPPVKKRLEILEKTRRDGGF